MSDDSPRFKIAFSTMELDGKIPPGSPIWREFNGSFENYEATLPAIAYMIDAGRAFTTWHANGWRTSENYLCGQHIGIDFDSRSAADAMDDPFVARYGALVYATPSSTPETPRSRALFVLDQPIMQAQNYVRAAEALLWIFGAAADGKCKDAVRFFYGSVGSMPTRLNNILPLDVVRGAIARHTHWKDAQPKPKPQPAKMPSGDDGKALAGTLRFAEDAPKGERNTALYWAARRWAERAVPRSAAETMAVQVARSNGLEDTEAYSIVRSAYRGAQ